MGWGRPGPRCHSKRITVLLGARIEGPIGNLFLVVIMREQKGYRNCHPARAPLLGVPGPGRGSGVAVVLLCAAHTARSRRMASIRGGQARVCDREMESSPLGSTALVSTLNRTTHVGGLVDNLECDAPKLGAGV